MKHLAHTLALAVALTVPALAVDVAPATKDVKTGTTTITLSSELSDALEVAEVLFKKAQPARINPGKGTLTYVSSGGHLDVVDAKTEIVNSGGITLAKEKSLVDAIAPAAAPGFGPNAPVTQDFMYPSIGTNCLADGTSALATALSVAGPATIPLPGPKPGQTAYVFTAVGTPGPAEVQKLPLNVTWVNLTTGKSGTVTLTPRTDITPEGPTTLTAIADTGSGSIMSTIFGQVTTKEKQCQFMPTIGSTVVP